MNPNLKTAQAMPPSSPIDSGSSDGDESLQTVPLSFLAQPDDKEQMQTPAKGDSGTMQVDYTIEDIQGDNAIVRATAINGNDLASEEAGEPADEDAQEGQALQAMASQMDNQK